MFNSVKNNAQRPAGSARRSDGRRRATARRDRSATSISALPLEMVAMSTSLAYPVHVNAALDPKLSRWLWLVKWILVLPHHIVLAFLWIGFAVTSVVAFFAILFTKRYPRAIFDYNVGV